MDRRDGMTLDRAVEICREMDETRAEFEWAYAARDIPRMQELLLKIENINKEAQRLNRVRRQHIVGHMGPQPQNWSEIVRSANG